MKLNVLIFGSGAREQAIAESILHSPFLKKLFVTDTGFQQRGEVVGYTDFGNLAQKCVNLGINIAIIGPEEPICEGIVDVFKTYDIPCVGVNEKFSKLESSKLFAKQFMKNHGIKTAKYSVITRVSLPDYDNLRYPIVIKADGLCGGKGVVVANNKKFAQKTVNDFLSGKFGKSSEIILLEEYLQGEEISLISLWDGKNLLHFAAAKDFKKLNKSESAPNTGGMGAYCPVKFNTFQKDRLDAYKIKLERALIAENADFVGFIYSGLIMTQADRNWDWHVLEFNVRLGDPEAQAILGHLQTDFLMVLKSALEQGLDKIQLEYNEGYSACLVLACEGYPKSSEFIKSGNKITLPETIYENRDIKIFYSGVEERDSALYSTNGRVLSLCTTSDDPFWTLKNYAKKIKMEHKYFRTDMEVR